MADLSFIRPFSMLRAADYDTAGGKGAGLGELEAAAVPMPPGYVVLTWAWRHFLECNNLEAKLAFMLDDVAKGMAPADVSQRAMEALEAAELPAEIAVQVLAQFDGMRLGRVAVRPSPTSDPVPGWAGQLDSFLGVTRATLLERVRACWASLFSERALLYRKEHGMLEQTIDVAVAVQRMVDADVAGVGVSVDPTEPALMRVKASYGLGEAVVSGAVIPDTWWVSKSEQVVTRRVVGHKTRALRPTAGGEPQWKPVMQDADEPCLTDEQVVKYAELLTNIEQHYGGPVETEWAMRDGKFWVLQARRVGAAPPRAS